MHHRFVLLLIVASCATATAQENDVSPRAWVSAEYLLWWTKNSPLPVPLVTSSNPEDQGLLGAPSTRIAIGNEPLDLGMRSGGRFTAGMWLDTESVFGVEASYFFLGAKSVEHSAFVDGVTEQVLAIPFVDVTPGGAFGDPATQNNNNTLFLGVPISANLAGAFAGTARLTLTSKVWGAELNGLMNLTCDDNVRIDLLSGLRYLYLRERMEFATSSPSVPVEPGEFFRTSDAFDARNNFYGGQVGTRLTWLLGSFSVTATGKVALGVTRQRLEISGVTETNDFTGRTGPGLVLPGGYLAQPSNIGHDSRNRFGVLPEGSIALGYQPIEALRLSVGYTFLYLNSVVRPGEQIDRALNGGQNVAVAFGPNPPGLLGGPARPMPLFHASDFWAQGITFSAELRF